MVSITLQNSANFVRPMLKNQPISVIGQEPGLFCANLVLQTVIAPPLKWPWNRRTFNFPTVIGSTDYPQIIPDFGFIETQWLVDSTGKSHGLSGATTLGIDVNQSRPTTLAAQYDDNMGTITFRVKNTPDAIYTVWGDYQRKPALLTSPASMWDVVPDNFGHVYNLGFLTFLSLLVNDSRFPVYERWFLARILALQDGLDDQARDIFLANWMQQTRTIQRSQNSVQQGTAGRGT